MQVAEVIFPTADGTPVELGRLRGLEAKAVTVRTLSAQGESADSAPAAIPPDLLVPPALVPRVASPPKPLASVPDTKDEHPGVHDKVEPWEQTRTPAPTHSHLLELPGTQGAGPGRRSPSPSRILPQPQGAPVSTSVAKAMAREAAQRVAESSRVSWGFPRGPSLCTGCRVGAAEDSTVRAPWSRAADHPGTDLSLGLTGVWWFCSAHEQPQSPSQGV